MSEIILKPIGQVKTQSSEAEIRGEGKDLAGELGKSTPSLNRRWKGSTVIPIFLSLGILTG